MDLGKGGAAIRIVCYGMGNLTICMFAIAV